MSKRVQSRERELDSCNCFVKYLPAQLTDDELFKLFNEFGDIVSSKIMIDQTSGKSLGYGFVRFRAADQAQLAIEKMNGQKIFNKRLLCKLANHSPPAPPGGQTSPPSHIQPPTVTQAFASSASPRASVPSNNLYIRPLLPSTTEEDLKALFGKYGEVVDAKVMLDRNTGQSRLIGFVRFGTEVEATDAMNALQAYQLEENATPLQIKYADTERQKEQRRARNQHSHQQHMNPQFAPGSPVSGISYWGMPMPAPVAGPMPGYWAAAPGMTPPQFAPGWAIPAGYGMPMPPYVPPHMAAAPHEAVGASSAHAPAAAGGETGLSHSPVYGSEHNGQPNSSGPIPIEGYPAMMSHPPPHVMGSPPMMHPFMDYNNMVMGMHSMHLSPPMQMQQPHFQPPQQQQQDGDSKPFQNNKFGEKVSPISLRRARDIVPGAGGETGLVEDH